MKKMEKNNLHIRWKTLGLSAISTTTNMLIPPLYWDCDSCQLQGIPINWFVGLDIHKEKVWLALYGIFAQNSCQKVLGPIECFSTFPTGMDQLVQFLLPFNPQRIVMENTGVYSNYPFHRLHRDFDPGYTNQKVICMNSRITTRHLIVNKKTDKVDAQRLAQLASIPEFLEPSAIATEQEFALRGVLRIRNKYQYEATKLKNRIKTLLSSLGFQWKFEFGDNNEREFIRGFCHHEGPFQSYLHWIQTNPNCPLNYQECVQKNYDILTDFSPIMIPQIMKALLLTLFSRLYQTEGEIECFDKIVTEQLYFQPQYKTQYDRLEHIFGMGPWCIASILLESGDITRFKSIAHYLSYAGISAGKEQSAEIDIKKKPNPYSNHLLKFAYRIVASTILNSVKRSQKEKMHTSEEDTIVQYAIKIQNRNLKFYQKANKLASKVARIVYAVLKSNEPYDPAYTKRKIISDPTCYQPNSRTVKRVNYLRDQLEFFQKEFQTIFQLSNLTQRTDAQEIIHEFKNLTENLNREPILSQLRENVKNLRRDERKNSKKALSFS